MIKKKNIQNSSDSIVIFADGASLGNPGPGGYGAVVLIPKENDYTVKEVGGREKHTTNNRMELMAAIKGLELLHASNLATRHSIKVHTDSSYVINGITKWVFSWERRNWVTMNKEPVLNKDLWEELLEQTKIRPVEWIHVAGHSGIPGNERVDEIAGGFAEGKIPELFSGDFKDYKIKDIFDIKIKTALKKKSKSRAPKIGYYLSKVDGKIMTHKTWDECKRIVLGVKGAKFKKVANQEEEREVLKGW
ncbi:MAG: ribonuclease HI [Patescibacteria group bacterium]